MRRFVEAQEISDNDLVPCESCGKTVPMSKLSIDKKTGETRCPNCNTEHEEHVSESLVRKFLRRI